ncbi:hypothetical protein T492DRAFT_369767 [Pavlovales sp. CCMP2436]|nr:hypothetical protein T492DRAFT_369767 [Pavlovales sp. CCMP2436]
MSFGRLPDYNGEIQAPKAGMTSAVLVVVGSARRRCLWRHRSCTLAAWPFSVAPLRHSPASFTPRWHVHILELGVSGAASVVKLLRDWLPAAHGAHVLRQGEAPSQNAEQAHLTRRYTQTGYGSYVGTASALRRSSSDKGILLWPSCFHERKRFRLGVAFAPRLLPGVQQQTDISCLG